MKPRKWVIVVFACILIFALGLFEGVRHVEKSRHLEQLLTAQLSAATGGDVVVGRVRLGFFSVYLQNIRASLSLHTYTLAIRDIKISFSLLKLFSTHGDFSKSISKIILISPELDFRLYRPAAVGPSAGVAQQAEAPVQSAKVIAVFRSLPVDYLLIRKGIVTLSTGPGETGAALAEDLAGKMWEDPFDISVELRGKLASRKKNMFLSASFSKTGKNHRVSLRLDKAEITRPLRIKGVTVAAGVLDGVAELSFPDSVTAATFESNGWVRVSRGSCKIDGVDSTIAPIGLYATLANTTLRVDSVRAGIRGTEFFGKGEWDLAAAPSAETGMLVRCQGVRPENLTFLPQNLLKTVSGAGWMELSLVKQKSTGNRRLSFQAGGISVAGQSISLASGQGRWEGDQMAVDSLSIAGPGFMAKGSGIVNYEKPPVAYTGTFSCRIDSVHALRPLKGRITMAGSVRGLGPDYVFDGTVSGQSLEIAGLALGSPELRMSVSRNKPVSFSSTPADAGIVTVMGIVDSLGTPHEPIVTVSASMGTSAMRSLLERLAPKNSLRIDTSWTKIAFKGTPDAFSANGALGATLYAGVPVRGTIGIQIDKKENEKFMRWQLYPQGLTVSGGSISLRGQGTISADSLTVDSITALAGLKASGTVRFPPKNSPKDESFGEPDIMMNVSLRDVSLQQVCGCAFGTQQPMKNGSVDGMVRIRGPLSHIRTDSDVHVRGVTLGFLSNLEADVACMTRDTVFTILPTSVRQGGRTLVSVDTISNRNGLSFSGEFRDVDVLSLIKNVLPDDFDKDEHTIAGFVSGRFGSVPVSASASSRSIAANVTMRSGRVSFDTWHLDSISANMTCNEKGLSLRSLSASDSGRVRLKAGGFVPWSAFSDEQPDDDTLLVWASASGDLVASVEHNLSVPFHLPLAGHGVGTIDATVRAVGGNYAVTHAALSVPRGVLRVKPYVPEDIKDFSMRVTLDNPGRAGIETSEAEDAEQAPETARLSVVMSGTIGHRPVSIRSTHDIPAGFEPLTFGFVDIGALLVSTPKHGIDVHIPGYTEIGAVSDVEFAPKAPWPEFALSGPLEKLCISGTWILRNCDITFPMLDNMETHVIFDPFPYISWNFDMKSGNRKVKYYYDTGKNRNLMRLVELYFDPVSVLAFRGRFLDNSFRLEKGLRFSTGSVFFGRTFDRNVDVGLDFVPQRLAGGQGYDFIPIIWGSAEAVSDTNRFDRIKLTLLTRDSITGAWMEKGRFYDIHFRVGSTIEDIPGQTQQRFVQQEKDKYASLPGAGAFATTIGEQYLHRILLQNMERKLAKTLGLDVITIETSIASNYFNRLYSRQFELSKWDYLALANVGITFGRYILNDKVFLKWRTDLVPVDTVLQPQYNVGFEFQPLQYLNMDVNYGIHMGDKSLEANPQLNLELRLPIKDIRRIFDF